MGKAQRTETAIDQEKNPDNQPLIDLREQPTDEERADAKLAVAASGDDSNDE